MAELRKRQIGSLQSIPGIKEVKAGEIFEAPFLAADGTKMTLQITCPPQFPTQPPTLSIKPPHRVQHPEVHPMTQEIFTPELQSQWAPQRAFSDVVKRVLTNLSRATNISASGPPMQQPGGPYPAYQAPYNTPYGQPAPYYVPPGGPPLPPLPTGAAPGPYTYSPYPAPTGVPRFPPPSGPYPSSMPAPYPAAPAMGPYPATTPYPSYNPGPASSSYPGYGAPQLYGAPYAGAATGPYPSAPGAPYPAPPAAPGPYPTATPATTAPPYSGTAALAHHPSTSHAPPRPTAPAPAPAPGPVQAAPTPLIPSRPAPPPPVTGPAPVLPLPGLAGKTAEELQRLLDDAGALDDFLVTQKPYSDLTVKENELRERNQTLAEKNLARRAELEAAETRLRKLIAELDGLRSQVDAETVRHQAATERLTPRALTEVMAEAERTADTKSEALTTQLTAGTLKADEFCKQYLAERKTYHLRSMKLALLRERGLVQ